MATIHWTHAELAERPSVCQVRHTIVECAALTAVRLGAWQMGLMVCRVQGMISKRLDRRMHHGPFPATLVYPRLPGRLLCLLAGRLLPEELMLLRRPAGAHIAGQQMAQTAGTNLA